MPGYSRVSTIPELPQRFANGRGLRLRPAQAADDAFARRLFVASRAGDFARAGLIEPVLSQLLDQQFRLQALGHARQFPGAMVLLIEVRHVLVGRLVLDCAGPQWHVVDIALLPAHRGVGIGSAVMNGIEAAGRLLEACAVSLMVLESNSGARRLYAKLGFVETGTAAAYFRMIKHLHSERPAALQ